MQDDTPSSLQRLLIRRNLQAIRSVELVGEGLTIGRSPECDIELDDASVSRSHARVRRRADDWYILDNASTNGVLLNGRPVTEARLQPGDVIEIRPYSLNYIVGHASRGDRSFHLADTGTLTTAAHATGAVTTVVKQRLEDLYSLARAVVKRSDEGAPWAVVRDTLHRSLSADRCVLMGLDETVGLYRLAPTERTSAPAAPLDVSRSVLREVIEARRGILIKSVADDQRYADAASLVTSQVNSVLCVPVVVAEKTRAIVYADRRYTAEPFVVDDLEFVTAAVDLAAAAVELDELHAQARQLARMRGRIEAAREMQELLLPTPIPQPSWGAVAARNFPAEQLSGDIYDVSRDRRGGLIVSVADVSGKGVPASFLTAVLQGTLRASIDVDDDLEAIVRHANRAIEAQTPTDAFITACICRWSPVGDSVEVANAGHPGPLWVRADGRVECFPERKGLALGVTEDWMGEIVRVDAADVASMVLYTDGATEAHNAAGEQYGVQRLREHLARIHTADAAEIVTGLAEGVMSFCGAREPDDDITILVVRRGAC